MSAYGSGGNLSDIDGGWVIEGLRFPDLAEYLSAILSERGEAGYVPAELLLWRSQLFSNGGNDTDAARNYPELANSILRYATRWDALSDS